jgi:hypothetical protein
MPLRRGGRIAGCSLFTYPKSASARISRPFSLGVVPRIACPIGGDVSADRLACDTGILTFDGDLSRALQLGKRFVLAELSYSVFSRQNRHGLRTAPHAIPHVFFSAN